MLESSNNYWVGVNNALDKANAIHLGNEQLLTPSPMPMSHRLRRWCAGLFIFWLIGLIPIYVLFDVTTTVVYGLGAAMVYAFFAYIVLPYFWKVHERKHPNVLSAQKRTLTAQGIPGDPINVGFSGSEEELQSAINTAGWVEADPITWGSSKKIVLDSLDHRAYANAPVSDLFINGRKQDLAFEQTFGPDPSKRHHVRFWKCDQPSDYECDFWIGSATFDKGVGVSHLTGQVTHHIDADIDKERDKLGSDFAKVPGVTIQWIDGFQTVLTGKNGGGDPYFTDGRLCLAVVDSVAHSSQVDAAWSSSVPSETSASLGPISK